MFLALLLMVYIFCNIFVLEEYVLMLMTLINEFFDPVTTKTMLFKS